MNKLILVGTGVLEVKAQRQLGFLSPPIWSAIDCGFMHRPNALRINFLNCPKR
jgi:hypothetical protein